MTSGEHAHISPQTYEMGGMYTGEEQNADGFLEGGVSDGAQPGEHAAQDYAADQLSDQQQLERLLNRPIELDLSFAEKGAAIFGALPEGVYEVAELAASVFGSDVTADDRMRICNVVQTSGLVVPLKNSDFYVPPRDDPSDLSRLEQANAIVDRIAELIEQTPQMPLEDALIQIRSEGQLLPADPKLSSITEAIVHHHPRIQVSWRRTIDHTNIRGVLAAHQLINPLPATVGESISNLLNRVEPGARKTINRLARRMQGKLKYTPETVRAFTEAIQLDPRFLLVRLKSEKDGSPTYVLKPDKSMREPLLTVEDYCKTPVNELVDRAIEPYPTCDLRTINQIIIRLTRSLELPRATKAAIREGLLKDPRVSRVPDTSYVQILHSAEDRQQYDKLAGIVDASIQSLRDQKIHRLGIKVFQQFLGGFAHEKGVELTRHTSHMLQTIAHINPNLKANAAGNYLIKRAPKAPENSQDAEADAVPTPEKIAAVATAASVSVESNDTLAPAEAAPEPPEVPEAPEVLLERLVQDRANALRLAVDNVVARHVNEGAITMIVDHLVNLAASTFESDGTSLSAAERACLKHLFAEHERFETVADRPDILGVRIKHGQSRIVRGVANNVDRLRTLYLRD